MRSALFAILVGVLTGCATVDRAPPRIEAAPQLATSPVDDRDRRADEIVIQAMSVIGVPYRYGGSSPQTGFDCSGLVRHVYQRVTGHALPYDAQRMSELGAPVERSNLKAGDLVFFNTLRRPYSHVGIYVGEHRFVHAPSRGGSVEIVDMADRYWRQRYDGARRLSL